MCQRPTPTPQPAVVPPLFRIHPEAGVVHGALQRLAVGALGAFRERRSGSRGGAEGIECSRERDWRTREIRQRKIHRDPPRVQASARWIRHRARVRMRFPELLLNLLWTRAVPGDQSKLLQCKRAGSDRQPLRDAPAQQARQVRRVERSPDEIVRRGVGQRDDQPGDDSRGIDQRIGRIGNGLETFRAIAKGASRARVC